MIKLIDLVNELGINNPNVRIPEGWDEIILEPEDIEEGIVYWFTAPMDGHDEHHSDDVKINKLGTKFSIETFYAFGEVVPEETTFDSIGLALKRAYEIMEEISDDWDEDDELNELGINKLPYDEIKEYIDNIIDIYYEGEGTLIPGKHIKHEFNEDHLDEDDVDNEEEIQEYHKIFKFLKGKNFKFNSDGVGRVEASTDEYGSIIIKWVEPDIND